MAPWSTAFANIGQYFQLPYVPGGKDSGRKSKLPQTYKPAPLVTPFQKYKKQQQLFLSMTKTVSSAISPDAPAPTLFEPTPDAVVPDDVHLRMEFARLRIRGHSHGRRPNPRVFFDHPAVRRRLEHQRWHDMASVHVPATHVPPSNNPPALAAPAAPPAPMPTRQSSLIVRQWHGLKQEVEAIRADMAVHAHVRSNPKSPPRRSWRQYEQRWAAALAEPEDTSDPIPMLRFHDIPWPTTCTPASIDGSHIHALDVHMFVFCTPNFENLPIDAMARITAEIERWRPQRIVAEVLPRVVPFEHDAVGATADAVLDILLHARRDIMSRAGAA